MEKRRHERHAVRVPATLRAVRIEWSGQTWPGEITDVSEGGFHVRTDWMLPEGEQVRVRFHVPDDEGVTELDILAEVRWSGDAGGFGLQFVDPKLLDRTVIDALTREKV